MTLFELWKAKGFEKYQTDKHSTHLYFIMYDLLFAPFQHKPVGVFEVGTNTGGSANLWDDYFSHPDTRIRSIDILDVPQSHRDYTSRLRLDIVDINKLTPDYFADFPVDIAIDDGSHTVDDQIAFVKLMYPIVREGGILIVEDISAVDKLRNEVKKLGYPFFIVDFNPIDNWYDSVLFIFMK